jgi:hypothetical protein
MYKAQVIITMEFPEAESLDQAQTTLDIWTDIVANVLPDRVSWDTVDGTPAHEERE